MRFSKGLWPQIALSTLSKGSTNPDLEFNGPWRQLSKYLHLQTPFSQLSKKARFHSVLFGCLLSFDLVYLTAQLHISKRRKLSSLQHIYLRSEVQSPDFARVHQVLSKFLSRVRTFLPKSGDMDLPMTDPTLSTPKGSCLEFRHMEELSNYWFYTFLGLGRGGGKVFLLWKYIYPRRPGMWRVVLISVVLF